jgi:thioredoxin reductase (NADPH)
LIETDVAIIGAGPIGLELAVALKRAGVEYLQFDARQIAHTISLFPTQTRFFSSNDRIAIAGVPLQTPDQTKSTREQYLTYLRCVVQQFDLQIRTFEPVVNIQRGTATRKRNVVGDGEHYHLTDDDGGGDMHPVNLPGGSDSADRGNANANADAGADASFILTTSPPAGMQRYRCRRLVLATGGTAHFRRLNIDGEDLPHVAHVHGDPHDYFRRRVLIVGGKNSAIEAALRLHHAGADVSLSYRRDKLDPRSVKYWILPEINSLLNSGAMGAYFNTVPLEITPTHVVLGPAQESGAAVHRVEADVVLLTVGYVADMTLCRLAGVELAGPCQAPVYDPRTMETRVKGLYLAGTVTGGTQDKYTVFIENGHAHIDRIVSALTGVTQQTPVAPGPPET